MIRALIFDMDGTLVSSEETHFAAWRETFARYGITAIPDDDYSRYVGVSNEQLAADYIEKHGLKTSVRELVYRKQQVYLEMIPSLAMMPGVKALLDRFQNRYRLAVASSSDRIELYRILEHLNLTDYFCQVVGGDMVTSHKPDPAIYRLAMDMLGIDPPQAVAFEDSVAGVTAAKRAGLYAVAIPSPLIARDNFTLADTILSRIDQADEKLLTQLVTAARSSHIENQHAESI